MKSRYVIRSQGQLGDYNGTVLTAYEIKQCVKVKVGKGIYFLLSATSSMPLALYNGTHILV